MRSLPLALAGCELVIEVTMMTLNVENIIKELEANALRVRSQFAEHGVASASDESTAFAISLANSGCFREVLSYSAPIMKTLDQLEPSIRADWFLVITMSLYVTGQLDDLQSFLASSQRFIEPHIYARGLIKLAWGQMVLYDIKTSEKTMEQVNETCSLKETPLLFAESMYLQGFREIRHFGHAEEARQCTEVACTLFRLQGHELYLTQALQAHAVVHASLGHTGYSRFLSEEALTIAARLGNFRSATEALRLIAMQMYHSAEFQDSDILLSYIVAIHKKHKLGMTSQLVLAHLARAHLYVLMRRPEDAIEALISIRPHLSISTPLNTSLWHEYHATAQFQLLDYMAALESYERAKLQMNKAGIETYELAEVYWNEAEVYLAMHDPRVALDLTEKALEVIHNCGNERELGQILRVKGTALAMLGQTEEVIPLFEQSIEELRRRNSQYELALTLTKLAETLEQDAPRAAEAANEAVAIFTRIGLPQLASDALHARDVARLRIQAFQRAEERNRIAYAKGSIIAESSKMKELLEDCRLVARSSAAVVVSGETGVGKEVVARYIHEQSKQAEGPFVAINCAALPESLFERELFGHKKGAFTGAVRDSIGLVTSASGGTLFFDEIGELPLPLQAKLLRLLQDSSYRRVGDVTEYQADIRILAATNRNLQELVAEGRFREDLWYRLNAFDIRIPPLRERTEDIAPLTDLFLERESENEGIEFWMDKQARQLFERYAWPGNVRELESAVRAGTTRAIEHGCVRIEHLPRAIKNWNGRKSPAILSLDKHLEVEERRIILHTLRRCNNSRADAARFLGIGRNTLYEKMQRLGITIDKEASA